MSHLPRTEKDALALVTAALAAADEKNDMWSAILVKRAQGMWLRTQGRIPSIREVAIEVGEDRADRLVSDVVERRRFVNLLLGYRSPCNYCKSADDLVYFSFALLRVESEGRTWAATAATALAGVVSLTTLGAAAVALPSKTYSGAGLSMKLVVCKACCKKHGNFFGLFMMNEQRASTHPLWDHLHEAGFTKFLTEDKMPWELKISPETDL